MNKHSVSIKVEHTVSKVLGCDRGGLGGFVDADHFDRHPFDAALIVAAARYGDLVEEDVRKFFDRWYEQLQDSDLDTYKRFSDELSKLLG